MERFLMTHEFGSNGHIVDAFIAHLKGMTPEQWESVIAARDAAWDPGGAAAWAAARDAAWGSAGDAARFAAYDAAGYDAWYAAGYAAAVAAWDVAMYAAGYAAGYAASEIQGADLMRERNQPFFFLPLFGFADEKAIVRLRSASR